MAYLVALLCYTGELIVFERDLEQKVKVGKRQNWDEYHVMPAQKTNLK